MKFRWNSRLASHLAVVIIVITLLLLGWRMSPNVAWFPNLETEPLFESDQLPSLRDVIDQPEGDSGVKPVLAAPQEEEPDVSSESVQAAEAEAPQPEVTPTPPQPQLRDLEAEKLYESWSRARQLLRQRDLAGAEQAYLELTNRWPRHPDLVGELGNVYILLGEKNSARTAFGRAQKLLEPMGPSLQLEAVTRWLERHR